MKKDLTFIACCLLAVLCCQVVYAEDESISCGTEPISIYYGDVVSCEIDPVGDVDTYHFQGADGENVFITTTNSGSSIQPCIELIAPDGSSIDSACGASSYYRIDADLDQTGRFSVLVSDWLYNASGEYTLTLQCNAGDCPAADETCLGRQATIIGNENDNVIYGTEGDDVIVGLGGNDIIYGFGGRDRICGGDGDDIIYGGDGVDYLSGDNGNDVIRGETDNDKLWGGRGNDTIDGGGGKDKIKGESGNDTLYGSSDDDKLYGGSGTDVCDGGKHGDSGDTADDSCECVKRIENMP